MTVILLIDPLPLLRKAIEGHPGVVNSGPIDDSTPVSELSNCMSRDVSVTTAKNKASQSEILSPITQRLLRVPWSLTYDSLFSPTKLQDLGKHLYPFQSTQDAFKDWLLRASSDEVASYANRLGPASMIFRVVHQDTLGLLQLMRLALVEINRASSDRVLQERALHWRYRLDQFRAQLVELEESFTRFAGFIDSPKDVNYAPSHYTRDTVPIEHLLLDGTNQITSLHNSIQQAYTSLTSKVQISDSHRSIAEAETVTKLTELAFLFIPLSFATSIFGMQMINNSTPISTYVVVALTLTASVYALRLFIHRTADYRMSRKQAVKNSIRTYARLRSGSQISTALALRWVIHIVWKQLSRLDGFLSFGAISLLMLAIPLSVLWTRNIDTGIKAIVTCLLLLIPIVIIIYPFLSSLARARKRVRLVESAEITPAESLLEE